jgi:VanZ family protein
VTPSRPVAAGQRWRHWYRRALPAYWVFLFTMTHLPRPQIGAIPQGDKMLHVFAFGTLAFFFWRFAEAVQGQLSWRFAWLAFLGLGLYGALDEWLQQFVGRSTDIVDWLFNLLGMALVMGWLEYRRRAGQGRTAAPRQRKSVIRG